MRGRHGGRGHEGAYRQSGGRGRHEVRAYNGRERDSRQGQGRSSGRGFDLSAVEHLGQLQEVVEQHAKQWAEEREYSTLVTAFDLACKVCVNMRPARADAKDYPDYVTVFIAHTPSVCTAPCLYHCSWSTAGYLHNHFSLAPGAALSTWHEY